METLALIALGLFASVYGTIIGAGGGFIIVPILLMLFGISPEAATATGLAIVFLNSIAGLPVMFKQKRVLLKTGIVLSVGAIPGTFLGDFLVTVSPEQIFYAIFACLLVGLGIFLMVKKPKEASASKQAAATIASDVGVMERSEAKSAIGEMVKLLLIGCLLGTVSSFFGIGGGWLLVPILVHAMDIPMRAATATSLFSLSIYSFVGVIPSVFDGTIRWDIFALTGIGVLVGAQIGAIVSKKMKGSTISRLLAVLVIIVGVNMFFEIL